MSVLHNSGDSYPFPAQRVPNSEKDKPEWYANCCDWIISKGINTRSITDIESKYDILKGDIPEEFYKKILNPYNVTVEKYKRFPATLRNYDMLRGTIRRYVSEYIKSPHNFTVVAKNTEIILAKNKKLQAELRALVEAKMVETIQAELQNFINQGGDPKQFNPAEVLDVEKFVKEFNDNYVDDVSAQGQNLLDVIRSVTNDELIYINAYFDFVIFGETYTYTDVKGSEIIKRNVSVRDAFPIPNGEPFVEDHDMFAERIMMSYQQILDNFDEYLDDVDRNFLSEYYDKYGSNSTTTNVYRAYKSFYPENCSKFTIEELKLFEDQPVMARDLNQDLYEVWHVVWRGDKRVAIVTYLNEINLVTQRIEEDNYKLNKSIGDISIEYVYEPQVYESVRIGTRNDAIYPYKARAIAYNRKGKLPYNGLCELLPGLGKFSLIEEIMPYQIFYNIVSYHREMVLAKHRLSVLLVAKSLLGDNVDDTMYRMLAEGVLYIDDENDTSMLKSQQIRMLTSSNTEYISQLTALLADIKEAAMNQVDMTPQRYGAIANSAGKGVTEQAIIQGSMGSVIINYMMDVVRERDYNRDIDFSKHAWIDGLDTAIRDDNDGLKYISLDVNSHVLADYSIFAKNSTKELEKLEQLKAYAFSAAQNGEVEIAIAAIMGDNVATVKKLITNYRDMQRQHEQSLRDQEQMAQQALNEFELQKISHEEGEKRLTVELEGLIKKDIELIKADANYMSFNQNADDSSIDSAQGRLDESRLSLERERLNLEKNKAFMDNYNKNEDRRIKEKDIDTKLKIAKANKNKHDK